MEAEAAKYIGAGLAGMALIGAGMVSVTSLPITSPALFVIRLPQPASGPTFCWASRSAKRPVCSVSFWR